MPGTVYLLHFTQPYRHARHYLGWAADLDLRLAEHRAGRGARLTQVIRAHGIDFTLALSLPGDRGLERALKRRHASPTLCPICRAQKGKKPWNPTPATPATPPPPPTN